MTDRTCATANKRHDRTAATAGLVLVRGLGVWLLTGYLCKMTVGTPMQILHFWWVLLCLLFPSGWISILLRAPGFAVVTAQHVTPSLCTPPGYFIVYKAHCSACNVTDRLS